jgi:uncharacterized damage-inducible protein DinB
MNQTIENPTQQIILAEDILANWLGHRNLTRRVIEAFPEKELFSFSIGGMRTFADMTVELLSIAGPGLEEIISGESKPLDERFDHQNKKLMLLKKWDVETGFIKSTWPRITNERFNEVITLFGQYTDKSINSIFYFIDNEIHHRAQGYVYLRALGIEPPFFYERQG